METAAFILAAMVGVLLGLIGAGGSILMVPILVYVMGYDTTLATSYSLFIIGITALIGAYANYRKGLVSIRTVFLFSVSSVVTAFIARKFVIPNIPSELFTFGDTLVITKSAATMVLFAVLMLMASISMIRNKAPDLLSVSSQKLNYPKLFSYGVLIGMVTGFLGAGGGFLIIPVLVVILGMPMKQAVGTSLFIIALNSLIAFTGDLGQFAIDWQFLILMTGIAAAGIFIGGILARQIDGGSLKKSFGWFILVMGIYILTKEIFGS